MSCIVVEFHVTSDSNNSFFKYWLGCDPQIAKFPLFYYVLVQDFVDFVLFLVTFEQDPYPTTIPLRLRETSS